MQLRSYQANIVRKAIAGGNTIVVLPTGSGKTLIAAELMKQLEAPSLFLVPTILLVEQQAREIRNWTGLRVGEYFGGASLPTKFDIRVSTPKAFQIAQGRGTPILQWSALRMVVFDEVHHVLKDHPYRKLALNLGRTICAGKVSPKILGLTASLTYAVGARQVEAAVARISAELHINVMATASETELRDGGYLGTRAEAAVQTANVPGLVPVGVVPQYERKPHLMHQTFFERVRAGAATNMSTDVYELVVAMEVEISKVIPTFRSPLKQASLKKWGEQAHTLAKQTANPMCMSLEYWYEALRALVISWEESEDAAIIFLRMCGEASSQRQQIWPQALEHKLAVFWSEAPESFPRIENLKDVLLYEHDVLVNSGKAFRGLLFVQQRVTTHILEHVIRTDSELAPLFRTACIYATTAPATSSLAVSSGQSKSNIAAFGSGEVNLLITTAVAEEGMDIPSANCVVSFDPMINAVSLVQRRGRARQADSSFVVLSEREDRAASELEKVEKQQMAIIRDFKPGSCTQDAAKQDAAQKSRERGARSVLIGFNGDASSALGTLNLYCKKTKVDLGEECVQSGSRWTCTLSYSSSLRVVSNTPAEGTTRKEAKKEAARILLKELQAQMEPAA